MASAVVDEALQGWELLLKDHQGKRFGYWNLLPLRQVRTFLLFARKWHKDVRFKSDESTSSSSLMLGSFLNRLEDSLFENGKNFLAQKKAIGSGLWSDLYEGAGKLNACIHSFLQEIAEAYITLSDYYPLQSGDQSLEFIDSLRVNMADLIKYRFKIDEDPKNVLSLREKLLFFKNFIRFAQMRGFEPWQLQYLVNHLQVVAVNAARLCYYWSYTGSTMLRAKFQLRFSELLLKIKPDDPQIRETYVQVLMASKFSGSSHALILGTDKHVLGDLYWGTLLILSYTIFWKHSRTEIVI